MPYRTQWLLVFCLFAVTIGVGYSFAQRGGRAAPAATAAVAPESLLPASAILYFSTDGRLLHEDAWRATAAYASLEESGLTDIFGKLFTFVQQQAEQEGAGEAVELASSFYSHLSDHGASLAATVEPSQNGPRTPTSHSCCTVQGSLRSRSGN
ncbi:MAG: hypothetical protein R3B90_23465 [Planctomycetaceae bacterium]